MNTLYEILEVSESASKEVIEKAYKVLAKRYHPDLQLPENKQMAEQKMKQINEAYDILSDDSKRKAYDEKLKSQREAENREKMEQANGVGQSNPTGAPYTGYANTNQYQNSSHQHRQQGMSPEEQRYREMQRRKYEEQLRQQQEQMQKQMEQQYENAYYNYLRSLGYRIKEGWTWEKTKKMILTLLIMAGILLILWIFPPTHALMLHIYETNGIVKLIIDIIVGIVEALFQAIGSVFQSLFNGW